ncbi:hypothetical protein KW800_00195 [Candidatus Parcubacteria bacterium]|nr:hypothetical protein [Candidatus Parcubacteria bacterium]
MDGITDLSPRGTHTRTHVVYKEFRYVPDTAGTESLVDKAGEESAAEVAEVPVIPDIEGENLPYFQLILLELLTDETRLAS